MIEHLKKATKVAGLIMLMLAAGAQLGAAEVERVDVLSDSNFAGVWKLEADARLGAKLVQDGDSVCIRSAAASSYPWDLKIFQSSLRVPDGASCVLQFRAKSDAPRNNQVGFRIEGGDYHAVSPDFKFMTGQEWKTYRFEFTAKNVGAKACRGPIFQLAAGAGALWLADATLEVPVPPAANQSPPAGYFAFATPYTASPDGVAIDVSFLNDKPAGVNGRILAKDGHFVEEKTGRRVRFLGINLTAECAFPPKKDAEVFARRLAQAGVNIARLHHLDNEWAAGAGGSLWDPTQSKSTINPVALDRLDYLIYQLKLNGIYSNINLRTARRIHASDGFDKSVDEPGHFSDGLYFVDDHGIQIQKDHARTLLTHVNPYTGMNYIEDPAVACVEINNESSILGGVDLPEPYMTAFEKRWTQWLADKYKSAAALEAAWRDPTPAGPPVLGPNNQWQTEFFPGSSLVKITPGAVKAGCAPEVVAEVLQNGSVPWSIQVKIAGVTLQDGAGYTVSFRAKADKTTGMMLVASKNADDWHNVGLGYGVSLGTEWQEYTTVMRAHSVEPRLVRFSFQMGTSALGRIYISDFQVKPGIKLPGLREGESLETIIRKPDATATMRHAADWRAFLSDTERTYADTMRTFLKDDLQLRANIILSQVHWGGVQGMYREEKMDYADAHRYWQHPTFLSGGWTATGWVISNTPQVSALSDKSFGVLGQLAAVRVAGKPFSVSEYDHPAPTDYACEMMPEYSTFAALQDWDIIYTFCAAPYRAKDRPNSIRNFFDQNTHPGKWSFYPTAALIFRQGLVSPLAAGATVRLPGPWELMPSSEDALRQGNVGFLTRRIATSDQPIPPGQRPMIMSQGTPAPGAARIVKAKSGQVFAVSAPSAVALVGYIGNTSLTEGTLRLQTANFGSNFAAVTVVATDNRSLPKARRILATLCGRVQNQGMIWNANRTTVEDKWGGGPTIAEFIPSQITLITDGPRKVFALNADGSRARDISSTYLNGRLNFATSPTDATLYYEIVAESYVGE